MSSEQEDVLAFLVEQRVRQSHLFPTVKQEKVLSFMATTSRPGTFGAVSIHRVQALEAGPTPRDLRVELAGPLGSAPASGGPTGWPTKAGDGQQWMSWVDTI